MSKAYLICPCPVANCKNQNKQINWCHANDSCNGKTMIRFNDIHLQCSRCGADHIIFDWKFSCSQHDYKKASMQGCMYALGIMGQLQGNQDQIRKATIKLCQDWPKES